MQPYLFGLLGCWFVGLLVCWVVGFVSVCWFVIVGLLVCWLCCRWLGLLACWLVICWVVVVGLLGCPPPQIQVAAYHSGVISTLPSSPADFEWGLSIIQFVGLIDSSDAPAPKENRL